MHVFGSLNQTKLGTEMAHNLTFWHYVSLDLSFDMHQGCLKHLQIAYSAVHLCILVDLLEPLFCACIFF